MRLFVNSGVYEIVNKVNGKRYVGSAVDLSKRERQHFNHFRNGSHPNIHLKRSISIHGIENFYFRSIVYCSRNNVIAWEQAMIDELKPEYNICRKAGNTSGVKFSQETKDKISASHKGRKHPPRSKEYREKISSALKGKKKSKSHMDALQLGRSKRVFTDELREKYSEATRRSYQEGKRSRERPPEYREKIGRAFAKFSDDEVREMRIKYENGKRNFELAKEYGVCQSTMMSIIKRKKYKWVS